MAEKELLVISKTYDLVKWSCAHTSRFPRSHRFVLGERIERGMYELLEVLIEAQYSRDRSRAECAVDQRRRERQVIMGIVRLQ